MSNPWAQWLLAYDTDPYVLSRKQGWDSFVHAGARPHPEALTRDGMNMLSEAEREDYDEARRVWNVNPPIVKTHQLTAAFSIIDQVRASNARGGDRSRGMVGP
ncbi:MAG: hypothetical protein WBG36_12765 [Ornithinimicrobium sp.]